MLASKAQGERHEHTNYVKGQIDTESIECGWLSGTDKLVKTIDKDIGLFYDTRKKSYKVRRCKALVVGSAKCLPNLVLVVMLDGGFEAKGRNKKECTRQSKSFEKT